MKTRPTCRLKGTKVVVTTEDKRQFTLEAEEAMKLAHELMACGERALKKAGKR